MPATRLTKKYSEPQLPEPDILKAFILERMGLKNHRWSYDQLAEKVGMSGINLRKLMTEKHTDEWKPEQRKSVCKALGLDEGRIRATEYYYDNLPRLFESSR